MPTFEFDYHRESVPISQMGFAVNESDYWLSTNTGYIRNGEYIGLDNKFGRGHNIGSMVGYFNDLLFSSRDIDAVSLVDKPKDEFEDGWLENSIIQLNAFQGRLNSVSKQVAQLERLKQDKTEEGRLKSRDYSDSLDSGTSHLLNMFQDSYGLRAMGELIGFVSNVYRSPLSIREAAGPILDDYPTDAAMVAEKNKRIRRALSVGRNIPLDLYADIGFSKPIKEILVRVSGWDAVERQFRTITTARRNPNQVFFDYILMGYKVTQIPQIVWNESSGSYVEHAESMWFSPEGETAASEELTTIMRYNLLKRTWQACPDFYADYPKSWLDLFTNGNNELPDDAVLESIHGRSRHFRNPNSLAPKLARYVLPKTKL